MKTAFLALPASDLAASRRFYRELLELPLVTESTELPMPWFEVLAGTLAIRIYEWTEPFQHRGHTGLHLSTDRLDLLHQRLSAESDVKLTEIRVERWGGRVFTVWDPGENNLDLVAVDSL